MSGPLAGRFAVVTGGAAGIGLATARRLLTDGASVMVVDLAADGLTEAAQTLAHERVTTCIADVTRDDDVDRVAEAVKVWGGLDILFNNAGVPGPVGRLLECPEDALRHVLEVNVVGVWRVLRRLVPLMRPGGVIVNSGSTVGTRAAPMVAAYGASKQAVLSITRSAAVEFASAGLRVNAVVPGPIETAMTAHVTRMLDPSDPARVHERFAKRTLLRRFGEADEVASLVAFLASDQAAYITGQAFFVDGGEALT